MKTKVIRKLPELQANQEWACEGGCEVIRPKHYESVYKEAYNHDGGLIERESEFYYTCQHGHKLGVWNNDQSDYVALPDEYYQEDEPKVVATNNPQESVDLLFNEIESLQNELVSEAFLNNDQEELLETIITKATMYGVFTVRRDSQSSNNWIDVKDKMPEYGNPVFVYCGKSAYKHEGLKVTVAAFRSKAELEQTTEDFDLDVEGDSWVAEVGLFDGEYGGRFMSEEVTHWKPISVNITAKSSEVNKNNGNV